jgi:translation elongation factor EF-Ts
MRPRRPWPYRRSRALESTADADVLEGLGKQIAMHIAATSPASLSVDDLDADLCSVNAMC